MKTIFISAGGTGGHIFPAISVADNLIASAKIIWIGTKNGLESTIVPQNKMIFEPITISGFRRKGFLKYLMLPFILFRACLEVYRLMKHYKPSVVIGFGGYVSLPVGLNAIFMRIPLVIHEQNAIAGLSNKILAKFAQKILLGYPNAIISNKSQLVGNPVRDEIIKLGTPEKRYSKRAGGLNILILGGSLGAKFFNEEIPSVFNELTNVSKIIHQVGQGDIDIVSARYLNKNIEILTVKFIQDIATIYQDIDLVICRSGALTVSEICVAGLAAIFIPYPYAVDNHQEINAQKLVEQNAAIMIVQEKFNSSSLANIISTIDRTFCLNMAIKAHKLALLNAKEQICAVINSMIH